MRKITKLLLTAALLIVGVSAVNASKLNADLSKLSNGPSSTWDAKTNTMTWSGTSNNMISNFDFAAGDYKLYSKIVVNISELNNADGVRLQIQANGKSQILILNGTGTHEKSLTTDFGFSPADLEKFEWARLLGTQWTDSHCGTWGETPAQAVISEVYFELPTRELDVDLSEMAESSGNATWNYSTHTFAWTLNYSNSIALPSLTGNLSGYTTLNYNTAAGSSSEFRILIYYSNGAAQTTYVATVGEKSISFADMGVEPVNLAFISSINFAGASTTSGSVTLTSFSLSGPEKNYINAITTYAAPAGTTDLNGMTGAGEIKWTVTYPKVISNETAWCGDIDSDTKSVDISAYDYLHFVVTDASADANCGLRVFVWDGSARQCLYPRPIAEATGSINWTEKSWITTPGVYAVKISDYPLLRGFKALQGWAGNSGTITVSQAYVSSGDPVDYVPSGKYTLYGELPGSSALTAALAEASTTYYDATGVCGTSVDLTSVANPNAMFKANAGVLANTNNVIVSGVCNSLVLEDNHPFKAPADFTATAASYSTTINTTAQCGTLCLPFSATIPGGVTAYTLSYVSGNDAATLTPVDATISANTPVLLNGSGAATFTGSGAVDADATNVSGALTGVFANTVVPLNSYVLQNGASGIGFYKVASDITAKPFRAYLTGEFAGSKEFLSFNFDELPTAVNGLSPNPSPVSEGSIFNVAGQRMSKLQKGLNIVNGKKVMVK